ncbi:Acyl-CoA dehydrogenase, short-chain specific [Candidatus Syntrophocurvum alkaliphilum]|uniref:Acyl-CoA dehydrogenase, short-chain specific n=1 Tax=Candidatus Syntrophocurvum alkaliphilum TaxID=2293317 RepID=A0A6I6DB29_9FIRM|nr:acyl-CoA dehydrogenase [Candidatus Syntrophocurvum alkaliphilum]QGT98665.1 Acyl-CoA dehydrogenase, short-chain specific [Candidatus Syntrophocurvum alkaliphilum]
MNFTLNEEQQMFKDMVRKFAVNEIEPHAAELDLTHEFPMENFKKMADLGLSGIPIPEEYGGAGGDYLMFSIFCEELAKVCASTSVIMSVHTGLGCMSTYLYGSEKLKQKFLKPLATGEIIGAYALTEPNAGSDAASLKLRAEDKGDHYVLNGSKIFITNGGVAQTYCTFVKSDPTAPAGRGITCLIVEKDTPGFTMSKPVEKMGMNGSPTVELYFDNCKVPKENILGEENNGFAVAMGLLDGGRITIASQGLGIGEGALEYTTNYIKERQQFGKPLAAQQGVQFMVADMATQLDAAQLLVYRAAWLKSNDLPHSKEASMAKMFATDTSMDVTTNCVQLMGGYGYCSEFPVERMMRDVKVTQIYEGSNQIQRLIVGRHTIGKF